MLIADLHIHSKYSRATSSQSVPAHLDLWARRKGIDVVGTGDFTHPAWRALLKEQLVPAEQGLYTLQSALRLLDGAATDDALPRFMVTGEISSIYKRGGRVRKVHSLILLPSLEAADILAQKLEAIGNIHSDGRPILGLDARDLLEITLEACPEAVFIPAHIWTPHFSLFGAFSGFDTIEECFGDLRGHIHALETGLSSDPPMNARLSALDGYTLVSNSDAHSPAKLGREANLLACGLSYPDIARAIQTGRAGGFAGTIEFFPEEGKYHLDGHRNCDVCLTPAETIACGGRCPVCGKKLTVGVLHRVEALADRPEGFVRPDALPFESLVPLGEVIAASTGAAAAGKKVAQQYEAMLRALGAEFHILRQAPQEDIARVAGPCVAEGIRRLRLGQVQRSAGFDGRYGTIGLLGQEEIDALQGQLSLLADIAPAPKKARAKRAPSPAKDAAQEVAPSVCAPEARALLEGLNEAQRAAVTASAGTVAIIAGPGTGKTGTLVARIAYLVEQCGVKPSHITAVTFTNKAAGEMRARLEQHFANKRTVRAMTIGTFHAICLEQLQAQRGPVRLLDPFEAEELAQRTVRALDLDCSARTLLAAVSQKKSGVAPQYALSNEAFAHYNALVRAQGRLDFDDLLCEARDLWTGDAGKALRRKRPCTHLLVDEFQDINALQYQLVQSWRAPEGRLFVIGDPDQSIYGFRGSDAQCFARLAQDAPDLCTIRLVENYRSTPQVLACALPIIAHNGGQARTLVAQRPDGMPVRLLRAPTELSEGIFLAKEINRMVGGIDMLDAEAYAGRIEDAPQRGFSDICVLYRTHRQAALLEKCLRKESIPYVVAGRDDCLADPSVRATLCFFRFLLDGQDTASLTYCLKTLGKVPADLAARCAAAWQDAPQGAPTPDQIDARCAAADAWSPLSPWTRRLRAYAAHVGRDRPRALLEAWADEMALGEHEPFTRLLHMAVFHKDMASFLQTLTLGQERDVERSALPAYAAGAVTLMTLHAAKGLEFPVVFLCGVRKGCIPLESARHAVDISEERRLFYVGMTRARDELVLLSGPEPSAFLEALPQRGVVRGNVAPHHPGPEGAQMRLF